MAPGTGDNKKSTSRENKYLGVNFRCCQVYSRLYLNQRGTAYEGHCPRCLRRLRISIDPSRGVSSRFFNAW